MSNHVKAEGFASRVDLVLTVDGRFALYLDGQETGLKVLVNGLRVNRSDRTGSLTLTIAAGQVRLREYWDGE